MQLAKSIRFSRGRYELYEICRFFIRVEISSIRSSASRGTTHIIASLKVDAYSDEDDRFDFNHPKWMRVTMLKNL